MLTGLYLPSSGEILLDGSPVTDERREVYRQRFSAVFSDFFLFSRIEGAGAADRADIDAAARRHLKLLRLDHKVEVKDGALSTTDLSQGQRKRLALLSALLMNRDVYVFDEWAADQDRSSRTCSTRRSCPTSGRRGRPWWSSAMMTVTSTSPTRS